MSPATSLPFVGRARELEILDGLLREAAAGKGQVAFIEGGLGQGKSSLISGFRAACSSRPELADITFLHGRCHRTTGQENAYQPFADTLSALGKKDEKTGLGRFAEVFVEVAPDWLSIVPVVGPAIGAGIRTVSVAHELYFDQRRPADRADSMAKQYLQTIATIAKDRPLVLVLEEAQWIDASSCALMSRLAESLDEIGVLFLATFRMDDLATGHPLRETMHEAVARDGATEISLSGFSEDDCREYLWARYGTEFDPHFPAWLAQLTGGRPLFLSRYLTELEEEGFIADGDRGWDLDGSIERSGETWRPAGRLTEAPEPTGIEALLDQMMERLQEEEEELLQQGSVQGESFLSRVLAELTEQRETKVIRKLRKVAEHHRLIALRHVDGWYSDESEAFQFEHPQLHRAFYERLTPTEQKLYHRDIASILEDEFHERGIRSRQLTLEIAHHHAEGGRPVKAAAFHLTAARSSIRDGAFAESTRLCERALDALDASGREGEEVDELRAQATLSLLASSFWSGDLERKRALVEMAERGEAAAERIGAAATLAEIGSLKGNALVHLGEMDAAMASFERALEVARSTGDPLLECVALLYLGGQSAKRDLVRSVELRREALEVYENRVRSDVEGEHSVRMDRYFAQLLSWLGVGEFDLGNYSAAIRLLRDGTGRQRELGMTEDLVESLNFLGQVTLAVGQFEEAEAALQEAIAIEEGAEDERAWLGMNLALLGKVYVEAGRIEDAAEPMLRGSELAERTELRDLVSIARNYVGELLMHPDYGGRDLDAARTTFEKNAADCLAWGMERSAVMAYTLLATLELESGNSELGLEWSQRAIALLEDRGDMPAARTEEILFTHNRALRAVGRDREAGEYLERARDVLRQKTKAIEETAYKASFLDRVPVSRAILMSAN